MKSRHPLLLTLPLLLNLPAALAETEEENELAMIYDTKPSVSIATGNDLSLNRAPAVASVITAEDIKAMGAKDLDEVMESVPGIHVSRAAVSYFSIYTIRGITATTTNPQVLMLQNGIPTNSVFRGDRGQSTGAPMLENIARIEIIRGPGSAMYGADAFSGVINIITKTAATAPGTEFGVRAGSFNSKTAWVQHGSQQGAIDVAAYLNVGSTDGFKETITADAATRLDSNPLLNPTGVKHSLAPGSTNTAQNVIDAQIDLGYGKWRLRGGYKLHDNGTGAGISSALDPAGKEETERINADLSWKDPQFSENWGLGFIGSYLHHTEDNNYVMFPAGITFPVVPPNLTGSFPNGMMGSPARWERQIRVSGYATYSGFDDHNLRFGLGYEDLDLYKIRTLKNFLLNPAGVPVPSGPVIDYANIQPHLLPHRRRNVFVYAQDEWNFTQDWTLTAGLRQDNFSDFGSTTNPRLALVWDAAYNLTAKLLYGTAFRAPAFNDQYGVNPSGAGNPNLKPEKISTLEAAIAWQATMDSQLNFNVFHYNLKDTIRAVTNPAPTPGSTFNNTGKQHGYGMELEAIWDANRKLRLTGNYAWQRSIDDTTNQDAGYAPRHHIYLRGDWQLASGWLLGPQINWVADRKRASGDARTQQVPDYTTVDLTLRTNNRIDQWNVSASVRNLFDATVLEPSSAPGLVLPNDLPMAGRSLWLQANYKL